MLFDMAFDASILIRVRSDFTTRLQAVLVIGTHIVTYGAGAKVVVSGIIFLTFNVIAF